MEENIINEICSAYNKSEKLVKLLIKICEDNKVENTKELINEVCQKMCQNNEDDKENTYK